MCIVPYVRPLAIRLYFPNIETTHASASVYVTGFHSGASLTLHTFPLACALLSKQTEEYMKGSQAGGLASAF